MTDLQKQKQEITTIFCNMLIELVDRIQEYDIENNFHINSLMVMFDQGDKYSTMSLTSIRIFLNVFQMEGLVTIDEEEQFFTITDKFKGKIADFRAEEED
jgi:hypothetical protein